MQHHLTNQGRFSKFVILQKSTLQAASVYFQVLSKASENCFFKCHRGIQDCQPGNQNYLQHMQIKKKTCTKYTTHLKMRIFVSRSTEALAIRLKKNSKKQDLALRLFKIVSKSLLRNFIISQVQTLFMHTGQIVLSLQFVHSDFM